MPIINSMITSGIQPSGTKSIVANGTYDVTDYASADVQVPTTAPAIYRELEYYNASGSGYVLTTSSAGREINLTGITKIGTGALSYAYYNPYWARTIDLSSFSQDYLDNISYIEGSGCNNMFYGAKLSETINLTSLHSIGPSGLANAFYNTKGMKHINMPNVKAEAVNSNGLSYFCANSSDLETANLSGINDFGTQGNNLQYAFYNCNKLQSIDLSGYKKQIGGSYCFTHMCDGCTNLTSIDLSSMSYLTNEHHFSSAFNNCKSLTNFLFTSLNYIGGNYIFQRTFSGCTNLTDIYFNSLCQVSYRAFDNMLSGITGCTLHFPSNLDPIKGSTVISSLYSYPNFGGTNTAINYDLPTSKITGSNAVVYYRNPKDDTSTTLAWRTNIQDIITVGYTSGISEPQVGDTIYSDSACTTAITTIDSIA